MIENAQVSSRSKKLVDIPSKLTVFFLAIKFSHLRLLMCFKSSFIYQVWSLTMVLWRLLKKTKLLWAISVWRGKPQTLCKLETALFIEFNLSKRNHWKIMLLKMAWVSCNNYFLLIISLMISLPKLSRSAVKDQIEIKSR